MKNLLLPPLLLLVALLLLLFVLAATGSEGKADLLQFSKVVPPLAMRLYPLLLLANGIDVLVQRRWQKRWISITVSGGVLAFIACAQFVHIEGVFGYVFLTLASFVGVGIMHRWRNRMDVAMSNAVGGESEVPEGEARSVSRDS